MKKKDKEELTPPPRNQERSALLEFSSKLKGFKPAREVLKKVTAVPTLFPYYDWATGVNGHPLERITLIHGPSSHGKTTLMHGLGLSFLKRGHFYAPIDVEMTTPITWLEGLMGEYADDPRFLASRPSSYEETVDNVRSLCESIAEGREKKVLPPETSALIGVDSIRKLVPKRLMEKLAKGAEKESIDGMGGRAAQFKAALNAAWMDELIPLLHATKCTIILIARESENTDKMGLYDQDWKLTGGKSIFYDSSLVMRITRAGWIKEGSGEDASIIGERHRIGIYKSKIANKEDKTVSAFFNTSNGKLIPEGFDHARDVLELADKFGIIEKSGAWIVWDKYKWNGMNKAVKELTESPEVLESLDVAVRSQFEKREIEEDT